VDTTQDYQKREGIRFMGYGVIFLLILFGILSIAKGGSIKGGLISIAIGTVLFWISRDGDKRNKKIFGRK